MSSAIIPVGIFWDIENCPVPNGKSATEIIAKIRKNYITDRKDHREFEFFVCCNVLQQTAEVLKEVDSTAGVFLVHVVKNKNAADHKLVEGMQKFVDTLGLMNIKPLVVLITGDAGFAKHLHGYKMRLGVDVVLLHNQQCPRDFYTQYEALDWTYFCAPLSNREPRSLVKPKAEPGIAPVTQTKDKPAAGAPLFYLNVSGLPGKVEPDELRRELQAVTKEFQGTVMQVSNGQACISFKTKENADKALPCMNGATLRGTSLKASFMKTPTSIK